MSETSKNQVETLRKQLSDKDMGVRMKALHASRSLVIAERFSLLVTAAIDSYARIRYDAVSQLGTVGTFNLQKSYEVLSDRLSVDPELDVRAAAAASLGSLQISEAFDLLKTAYESTNDWMFQFSIIAALGELGNPQAFDLLSQALQSSNDLVKIAAIGSLGDLGDLKAISLLLPLVEDPDWQLRLRVAQALAQLGGNESQVH